MEWYRKSTSVQPRSTTTTTTHPYYPTNVALEDYVPNDRGIISMISAFGAIWAAILGATWYVSGRTGRKLGLGDRLAIVWFVLCGTLHVCFEGYFVFNHAVLMGKQDLFAQLWKEYAKSDSRYLVGDPFVLCAEALTVVLWGPLSYLTAYSIAHSSSWRHPLQSVVSLGHLYGDLLYFSTCFLELYGRNVSYSRPEPLYFWFYFVFLNSIWLVVPSKLLYDSSVAMMEAFAGWQEVKRIYQSTTPNEEPSMNGHVKSN